MENKRTYSVPDSKTKTDVVSLHGLVCPFVAVSELLDLTAAKPGNVEMVITGQYANRKVVGWPTF